MSKHTTPTTAPTLAPVLQLVHDQAGGLDDLQVEILRDEQASFPALPDPARCAPTAAADWVRSVRRAS